MYQYVQVHGRHTIMSILEHATVDENKNEAQHRVDSTPLTDKQSSCGTFSARSANRDDHGNHIHVDESSNLQRTNNRITFARFLYQGLDGNNTDYGQICSGYPSRDKSNGDEDYEAGGGHFIRDYLRAFAGHISDVGSGVINVRGTRTGEKNGPIRINDQGFASSSSSSSSSSFSTACMSSTTNLAVAHGYHGDTHRLPRSPVEILRRQLFAELTVEVRLACQRANTAIEAVRRGTWRPSSPSTDSHFPFSSSTSTSSSSSSSSSSIMKSSTSNDRVGSDEYKGDDAIDHVDGYDRIDRKQKNLSRRSLSSQSLRRAIKEAVDSVWRGSMARALTTETLFELVNLAGGPQRYLPSGLQVKHITAMDMVVTLTAVNAHGHVAVASTSAFGGNTQASEAQQAKRAADAAAEMAIDPSAPGWGSSSVWRPRPPKDYFSLGDIVFPHRRHDGEMIYRRIKIDLDAYTILDAYACIQSYILQFYNYRLMHMGISMCINISIAVTCEM